MDWDHLRFFLALAKDHRLVVAARSLQVNHTTIARRISALEQEMGVQLFTRSNSGYELTVAGLQLQDIAKQVEKQIGNIRNQVNEVNQEITGVVRIGTTEGFGTVVIAPILNALGKQYPKLIIDLLALPRMVNLSRREADIVITLQRPTRGPYLVTKLQDYSLHLYASPEYLVNNPPIEARSDLDKQTFISYIDDLLFSKELSYLDDICRPQRIAFRSTSIQAQLQAALSGLGIAILPSFMAESVAGLVPVLKKEIEIIRSFWMIMPNEYRKIDRMNLVWDHIKKHGGNNP
ncbi:MAG: LysR family transcriptional regulator [Polynucleobacter sp.]|jgi:DNA-binding transcriptional LysR family regulator|uniref:LysR family transcriptional regulator n=1 Tax=Polynucleobacter sp. 31A-FELB TaxID=2689096 RepID=UPI001B6632CA|nr:LysR family transcriptional regulator [Polynucleobacter sp. 31A-FELB]MBP7942903.1 LysR family transcriptional regulator [Polynucleobacter sp.]MBU3587224.1 LysR family transcriptional regulator [Polynucleobacter sp. 31A-FELB]